MTAEAVHPRRPGSRNRGQTRVPARASTGAAAALERQGDSMRKVAIITGASEGIGAGLVAGYRGRGWAVVASTGTTGPSPDPDLLAVSADIAGPTAADRVVEAALERFGRLDTLVTTADAVAARPFTGYTAADYARAVDRNLAGFFWVTQQAIAEMATRYGGHVVNIFATMAEDANSGTPAVLGALTKGALAAATRSLAVEYAAYGIRVNAVSPGLTDTPLTAMTHQVPGVMDAYKERIPFRRAATPEEIAAAALYLTCDDASYVSGVNLFVDGAWATSGYPDLRPYLAEAMAAAAAGSNA